MNKEYQFIPCRFVPYIFLIVRFSILFKSYLLMSVNMFCESADTLKNNNVAPPKNSFFAMKLCTFLRIDSHYDIHRICSYDSICTSRRIHHLINNFIVYVP